MVVPNSQTLKKKRIMILWPLDHNAYEDNQTII